MFSLSLYAGPRALAAIQADGLQSKQFTVMAGASGGPKWFVLHGLDRYLFGEFFAHRQEPLLTVGSSAGAWRMACLAQDHPVAAIDRLADLYSHERYSAKPDRKEITDKARAMLLEVLGSDGGRALVQNRRIVSHIIAGRCRSWSVERSDFALGAGMLLAAASNAISRRTLGWYFERVVFNNHQQDSLFKGLNDLPTVNVQLNENNVFDALLASGSIPFVLQGVRDIAGAKTGLYLDGGITDYHFDFPFHQQQGLVLYPHFYPRVVPGWFDKSMPWRKVNQSHFDNVLLITPSAEFVARLPYGKIPDREDFRKMDYATRVAYWETVMSESRRLADDFATLVDSQRVIEHLQAFDTGKDN